MTIPLLNLFLARPRKPTKYINRVGFMALFWQNCVVRHSVTRFGLFCIICSPRSILYKTQLNQSQTYQRSTEAHQHVRGTKKCKQKHIPKILNFPLSTAKLTKSKKHLRGIWTHTAYKMV